MKTEENVQSPELRKHDGVISSNDSFPQRTAKSVSTTDVDHLHGGINRGVIDTNGKNG